MSLLQLRSLSDSNNLGLGLGERKINKAHALVATNGTVLPTHWLGSDVLVIVN